MVHHETMEVPTRPEVWIPQCRLVTHTCFSCIKGRRRYPYFNNDLSSSISALSVFIIL
ncbi:MAG: hypothetical protein GY737_07710 [Desulfobacteraceae bacterium]|nr:hypothetical protein [Desulfobacteraceae bacterium]